VEGIKTGILIEGLSLSGAVILKRVVETAKLYYRDPEALKQSVNYILEEN
jgi:hypothetical protein